MISNSFILILLNYIRLSITPYVYVSIAVVYIKQKQGKLWQMSEFSYKSKVEEILVKETINIWFNAYYSVN